jgi:glycosyltransferase involved in cell wall biosynthesis
MRLCYIASWSIHTRRWVRYFAEQGHEVHLFSIHQPREPLPPGVAVHDLTARCRVRRLRFVVWAWIVRRMVGQLQPDILHAHQVSGAGWLGAAAGYHPFVVTAWGSDLLLGARRSQVQRRLARWVLHSADYVTCVSQNLAEAALSLGADASHLEVAPWGVDTQVFFPPEDRKQVASRLGLEPGRHILSPRALMPVYNPLDIARAIPLVVSQVPSARFIIRTHIYDPDLLASFQAIIHEAGCEDAVRYVGNLPDDRAIAELYRAAEVAVSIPSSDGTPSSVLEALACGAVPVVSDLPSLREWIDHGQEGLIVPAGDVLAVSDAIVRILADDRLCAQMRRQGRQMVERRADSRVWMRRSADLYRELLHRRNQDDPLKA